VDEQLATSFEEILPRIRGWTPRNASWCPITNEMAKMAEFRAVDQTSALEKLHPILSTAVILGWDVDADLRALGLEVPVHAQSD